MRKSVTAAAMAASLSVGGAAGAVVFVPTPSGAQTDDGTTEDRRGGGFLVDALAPLVEDGTISQGQADAVVDARRDARPDGLRHHRGFPFGEVLTEVLGTDAGALRQALAEGQTIAEIAEANGVAVDDVVAALVAEAQEHLDERVAGLTERITAMVDGELEPRFARGRDGHRGHTGGPAAGADDTTGS